MPERDDEQGEEREDVRRIWADDERPITLSRLLGESPEEAARRPQPPPPELKGSPSRSLLFVGFSAVVVACLVALGALVTHSGQFAVHVDRQLSGLSEDGPASEPGDLRPAIPPAAIPPSDAMPSVPAAPHRSPGAGPEARPAPSPGAGRDSAAPGAGRDSAGQEGAGRDSAGRDSAGRHGAGRDGAGSGAAPGAPVSQRDPSGSRSGTARDAGSDAGGGTGDEDGRDHRRERGDPDRSGRSDGSGPGNSGSDNSGSDNSGSGGGLLDTVDSVLEGLTGGGDPGALNVRLTDSWHDATGHDHSGRRPDHPGLRAAPAGVAPGLRLPGR